MVDFNSVRSMHHKVRRKCLHSNAILKFWIRSVFKIWRLTWFEMTWPILMFVSMQMTKEMSNMKIKVTYVNRRDTKCGIRIFYIVIDSKTVYIHFGSPFLSFSGYFWKFSAFNQELSFSLFFRTIFLLHHR